MLARESLPVRGALLGSRARANLRTLRRVSRLQRAIACRETPPSLLIGHRELTEDGIAVPVSKLSWVRLSSALGLRALRGRVPSAFAMRTSHRQLFRPWALVSDRGRSSSPRERLAPHGRGWLSGSGPRRVPASTPPISSELANRISCPPRRKLSRPRHASERAPRRCPLALGVGTGASSRRSKGCRPQGTTCCSTPVARRMSGHLRV